MPQITTGWIASPLAGTATNEVRSRLQNQIAALFDEFRSPLLRYLWSLGLPITDGEEIIQDVFLSLSRHLYSGKSIDNVQGWLFRVAHNLALRHREQSRRVSRDKKTQESVTVDPAPNPEDQLVNTQTQRRLLAVVEALPEQDRQCLFLRAEGLRYREIAKVLNISLGGVSLALSRSLARIARSAERIGS